MSDPGATGKSNSIGAPRNGERDSADLKKSVISSRTAPIKDSTDAVVETWLANNSSSDLPSVFRRLAESMNLDASANPKEGRGQLAKAVLRAGMRMHAKPEVLWQFAKSNGIADAEELDLAVALRPEAFAEAVQMGVVPAEAFGSLACRAKLPPSAVSALIASFDAPNRDQAVSSYFRGGSASSPLWARDFSESFPAKSLPADLGDTVVAKLLTLSAADTAKWLSDFSLKERDACVDRGFDLLNSPKGIEMKSGVWLQSAAKDYIRLRSESESLDAAHAISAFKHLDSLEFETFMTLCRGLPDNCRDEAMREAFTFQLEHAAKVGVDQVDRILMECPPEMKRELTERAALALARSDIELGLKYLAQIPDEAGRRQGQIALLKEAGLNWPVADRIAAINTLIDSGTSGDELVSLIDSQMGPGVTYVGGYNPSEHTQELKAFLEGLPGSVQSEVVGSFVKRWASDSPVAASDWIAALPAGDVRDRAARQLISVSQDDPEIALANSVAIGDAELRSDAVKELAAKWRTIDPAFFRSLLSKSSLKPVDREAALQELESN